MLYLFRGNLPRGHLSHKMPIPNAEIQGLYSLDEFKHRNRYLKSRNNFVWPFLELRNFAAPTQILRDNRYFRLVLPLGKFSRAKLPAKPVDRAVYTLLQSNVHWKTLAFSSK